MNRSLSFARLHERQQFPRGRQVLVAVPVQPDAAPAPGVAAASLRAHHQLRRHPLQVPVARERADPAARELLRRHRHHQGTTRTHYSCTT